jgi:hypothetical protein
LVSDIFAFTASGSVYATAGKTTMRVRVRVCACVCGGVRTVEAVRTVPIDLCGKEAEVSWSRERRKWWEAMQYVIRRHLGERRRQAVDVVALAAPDG